MPNPNRKTLLRALCLTAAGSALFASLHVGSTSAYFTSTATVQVADIQAGTWSNNAGQSDASEADSPVFLDEETIAPDTLLAAAPALAALTAEEPAATPSPTAEPTAHAGTYRRADTHPGGHRLKGTIQLADGAALTVHGKGMIQATARSHSRAGCPIYARGQGCPRGPVWRPLSGRCRILCRLCGGGAGDFARRPVRRKGRQRRPPAVQRRGWGHHRRGRAVCRV